MCLRSLRSRPRLRAVCAAALVSALAPPPSGAVPPSQAGPASPREETPGDWRFTGRSVDDLSAYCRDIRASHQEELGELPLEQLRARLAEVESEAPADTETLVKLHLFLATETLSQNQVAAVTRHLDAATRLLEASGELEQNRQLLRYMRAVSHLRLGEIGNCATPGSRSICLLTRGPDGIYGHKAHSLAAIEALEAYLAEAPDSVTARWLLNLAHQTVGSYPDAVPEAWRIPPERFASTAPAPRFVNLAGDLGVATVSMLGGAIMDDFDGDGLLDLFRTVYDPCQPVALHRNTGDGRLEDVTAAAGLAAQLGGFNAMQTDYDNDGRLDILILRGAWQHKGGWGRQRNSLLHNLGDGRFEDVTAAAGLAEPAYPTQAAAWADYDGDGDLDVYIGNERDASFRPYPSQLFRNDGDGRFTDVTPQAGVANFRLAKGVAWGDYDDDGDPDLYVSNIGPNRLYRNDGDGRFTDVAVEAGVTEPAERSFATWFWDYDNDGRLDIFVAGYAATLEDIVRDFLGQEAEGERPRLYRNRGDGGFEDVTEAVGLDRVLLPMGANFGDIDSDGWPDVYLGTGNPSFEMIVPNVLFRNDGGRRFVDVTASAGVGHLPKGHGVAFGDLDQDGDQDLFLQAGGFVPGDTSPDALFENPGSGHHWITLRLQGTEANRPAIGARLHLRVAGPDGAREIHSVVSSGGSFGANSLQQEIGLGTATRIEELVVVWPGSGRRQTFANLAVDRAFSLVEGEAPRPVELEPFRLRGSATP